MSKTIKVKVSVTLHVDVHSWLANYYDATPENIREHIRGYFQNQCEQQLEFIGCQAKTVANQ
jgi:hypothetical protein